MNPSRLKLASFVENYSRIPPYDRKIAGPQVEAFVCESFPHLARTFFMKPLFLAPRIFDSETNPSLRVAETPYATAVRIALMACGDVFFALKRNDTAMRANTGAVLGALSLFSDFLDDLGLDESRSQDWRDSVDLLLVRMRYSAEQSVGSLHGLACNLLETLEEKSLKLGPLDIEKTIKYFFIPPPFDGEDKLTLPGSPDIYCYPTEVFQGSFSECYLGYRRTNGEINNVFIKIGKAFGGDIRATYGLFFRAALIPQLLSSRMRGVVPVLEHGALLCGAPAIVMPSMNEGDFAISLDDILVQKIDLAVRLDYAVQISSLVANLHAWGVAHRDIKPKNFFLRKGSFYLGDFETSVIVTEALDRENVVREYPMLKAMPYLGRDKINGTYFYRPPDILAEVLNSERLEFPPWLRDYFHAQSLEASLEYDVYSLALSVWNILAFEKNSFHPYLSREELKEHSRISKINPRDGVVWFAQKICAVSQEIMDRQKVIPLLSEVLGDLRFSPLDRVIQEALHPDPRERAKVSVQSILNCLKSCRD